MTKAGPRLVPDGKFGNQTNGRVIAFQKRNHLKPDGIVGFRTRRALFRFATSKVDLNVNSQSGTSPSPGTVKDQAPASGNQTRRTIILPKDLVVFPKIAPFDFPHVSIPESPVLIVPPVVIPAEPNVEQKPPVVVRPLKLEWDFSPFQKPDDVGFDQKFKFVLHYPVPNPFASPSTAGDANPKSEDDDDDGPDFSFETGQDKDGRWKFKAGVETTVRSFKLVGPLQLEIFGKGEVTAPGANTELSGGLKLKFKAAGSIEASVDAALKIEVDPTAGTVQVAPDVGASGSLGLKLLF
jgi:peptidoglycan hydrolase-like protein with peptidoglycan-binding domain